MGIHDFCDPATQEPGANLVESQCPPLEPGEDDLGHRGVAPKPRVNAYKFEEDGYKFEGDAYKCRVAACKREENSYRFEGNVYKPRVNACRLRGSAKVVSRLATIVSNFPRLVSAFASSLFKR